MSWVADAFGKPTTARRFGMREALRKVKFVRMGRSMTIEPVSGSSKELDCREDGK